VVNPQHRQPPQQQQQQQEEQERPNDRPSRRPEPSKRLTQWQVRATTGSRFAASVISRYRSVSSFFARSSSVIGPATNEVVATRVAYRDSNGNDVEREEPRRPTATRPSQRTSKVSIVVSESAVDNDGFDVNWYVRISDILCRVRVPIALFQLRHIWYLLLHFTDIVRRVCILSVIPLK